jgi:hypothetical protein
VTVIAAATRLSFATCSGIGAGAKVRHAGLLRYSVIE